jgi:hypothetical protein
MSDEPNGLRWYQFSLRSVIVVIALFAIVLTLFLKDRSYRKMVDERVLYARLDLAEALFRAQLGMAEERLQQMKESVHIDNILGRDNEIDGYDGLRILRSWDFAWEGNIDEHVVRRKIRECLEPIVWLGQTGPRSAWEIKQEPEVNFFDDKKQGEIIVRATYRPYSGEPPGG